MSDIVTDFINGTMNKGTVPDSVHPATAASEAMSYDKQDVFSDWLFPAKKEYRQMAEQLQMDSIEPSVKMQGMIAAGINPLTAASAIAGSGSSAPQPASSVNPIGDVAGAVGAVAGAGDSVASAVSTLSKLDSEIEEIKSSAKANLAKAGLDDANIEAVTTDNKYRGENWEAELALKRQNFKNMQQELTNMKARHREIMTHCDEMISQIELNGSQKDYFEVMQLKIQEDLRWQKELNDFRINNKLFITDSGVDGYTWNLLFNEAPDGDVNAFFDTFYEYCKNRSLALHKGQFSAEAEYANQISYARKNGENASDVLYGRVGGWPDAIGRASNILGGHIGNIVDGVIQGLSSLPKIKQGAKVRDEVTMILNNAYEQLEKFPQDSDRLLPLISDLQAALQLSNSELLQWYNKRNE